MRGDFMVLVPYPKMIEELGGKTKVPDEGFIYIGNFELLDGAKMLKDLLPNFTISRYDGAKSFVRVYVDESQVGKREGYTLKIDKEVTIIGNDIRGAFYGMMTLRQILRQSERELPNLRIKDWPDFPNRGFMLDISRDKVPKKETLFQLVDLLSELKYNQLQLYTEHTFAYRGHEKVWKGYSPLTSEDILEIDEYARKKMIELVPNQNSFGHMEKWLVHDEYKKFAEVEDGFEAPWGWVDHPFSLSPASEGVFEFLESLYDELLPNFSSDKFNVGCDETFDLCQGKSKKLCEEKGKGRVYLEFILKIFEMVKKRGKTAMFWGDIIKNHPDLVPEIPDGVVALIWGYEKDHPFEEECSIFEKSGIPFYVCPGTSSWNAIVGRVKNMIGNVDSAIESGLKHGSIGVLMTDWGDYGHWQHLPFSFPGIVYAAAKSWNSSAEIDLSKALSVHVFYDPTLKSGKALLKIGNAYLETGIDLFNANLFGAALRWPERIGEGKFEIEKLEKTKEVLKKALEEFESADIGREDATLIKREVRNGVEMAVFSLDLIEKKLGKDLDLKEKFEDILKEFESIWLERNREGGLKESLKKLKKVRDHL